MSESSEGGRPLIRTVVDGRLRFDVRPVLLEALAILSLIGLALAAISPFLAKIAGSDWRFVATSLAVYLAIAGTAAAGLGAHPHSRFGPANIITSVRAALTALVAASLIHIGHVESKGGADLAWGLAALVACALLLDGVDGYAARRTRLQSRFGARFDMEVDALMIFLLSLVAFASGKAGAFVLALGGMRYAYLALHALVPRLPSTLAPSLLRKVVCVIQVAALCAIVTPVVAPPLSDAIALGALLLLSVSFARDLFAQVMMLVHGDGAEREAQSR
ncbi:CDP-alcohol phosphatidyltransferase family protein [Fulvimarina endophytica]|uniref:CDP-alcohol phosphatidyltransferase family protein n=1 Tax=Fulvimarina endophytica TaxID=2293836 RepID=A0A371X296_9HYPH|nr:CDP-alcohol phosphatidyltransferase family protein [Fulvimarina endophytica]RFC63348.1 CDP-alcohol phosphatidyltransferase family protein [Fulvimarina endophytica]